MSDFHHLSDSRKSLLMIKLDGYIEAAVHAARIKNIGLLEALSLTTAAVIRELSAYSVQREKANEIWAAAIDQIYNDSERQATRTVN